MPADPPSVNGVPLDAERWGDRNCFGCAPGNSAGLRLELFQDEGTGARWGLLTPRPEHEGPPGYLHGGLASTALDEIMGWAAHKTPDDYAVTASLAVKYRKPVPLAGGPYRVEGEIVRESGRRIRTAGRLLLGDGTVAVEGEAVFVRVTP